MKPKGCPKCQSSLISDTRPHPSNNNMISLKCKECGCWYDDEKEAYRIKVV